MHYDETILDLVRTTLLVTLRIAGPILAAGVVVGLVVSIVQAVTQIQDQALTFVPK
ncbi:MAG: flagellar biosynthetic protein FliQ, partial [Phycisphaerae bacterium]|nr:flagellar biosynthetic protein FliQ [Phycisphaerae bacterium]